MNQVATTDGHDPRDDVPEQIWSRLDIVEEFIWARDQLGRHDTAPYDLRAAGVPMYQFLSLNGIGYARVAMGRRTFEFDASGVDAYIVPVWHPDAWSVAFNEYFHDDGMIDLVAFTLSKPGNFRLRTGDGALLGLDVIRSHRESVVRAGTRDNPIPEPVLAHETPLDWLCSVTPSICVLSDDGFNDLFDLSRIRVTNRRYGLFLNGQKNKILQDIADAMPRIVTARQRGRS